MWFILQCGRANLPPTQAFWDKTGKQWTSGGFYGKMVGVFVSTGTLGGGQESTVLAAMSTFGTTVPSSRIRRLD